MTETIPSTEPPATRTGRRLASAVVVLVVVAVAAYLIFFRGSSKSKLSLSNPRPSSTASVAGTWSVAPGSTAGYRVREKLAMLPAQSDAVGRTDAVTGTAAIREEGSAVVVENASFQVDVTKLQSNEQRRDNRIRKAGLQTDQYPTATFAAAGPIRLPAAALRTGRAHVDAVGDLTLHGVTKRVTIPLDAQRNGDQIEVAGSLTFPFNEFGMDPPSIGNFVTVEPDATMEFRLVLSRAAG